MFEIVDKERLCDGQGEVHWNESHDYSMAGAIALDNVGKFFILIARFDLRLQNKYYANVRVWKRVLVCLYFLFSNEDSNFNTNSIHFTISFILSGFVCVCVHIL